MFGKHIVGLDGNPVLNEDGTVKSEPHYVYTMKQAIEEHFIMDVLKYYTPVNSYYHIVRTIEDDPLFDKKRADRILRYYVEGNKYAIEQKADVMVEHFQNEVISKGKVSGKARAMVVSSSIQRAIEYYFAITKLLKNRRSQYKAIVAFSGEVTYNGKTVSESTINGFSSSKIEKNFKKDPYRILVVANKFQTGVDEPLLHTMYVDKRLADVKAVQTLSRLNRSRSDKKDTFILDFTNESNVIHDAFAKYYKTTILSGETDVNKLNDLIDTIEPYQIYMQSEIDKFVEMYLNNVCREKLDPILDECTERYKELEMEEQIEFKSSAKTFVRTYNFLSSILPYSSVEWEKLSIFLNLLVAKLPSPSGDDHTNEIVEDVDLESYRVVAQETMSIALEDENAEIAPVPVGTDVGVPELDTLSNILASFHEQFGDIPWTDEDKVKKQIADLPNAVKNNEAYINAMKNSDRQNAKVECENATATAIADSMSSGLELYKYFKSNDSLQKYILDLVF